MYVLLGAPYPFFVFFHRVAPTGFRSLGAAHFRATGTVGGGQEGPSPPPPQMFAGIEGKSSPLKNIGLLLPSWIFRPSYGPGVSLLLRSSSLSQIATEEWRGEYISPRVQ